MAQISPELRNALANAPFPRLLGFRLLDLAEGYAKIAVTIRPDHANFQGGVDGALISSLADCAHACACNTLGQPRVGMQYNINFISGIGLKGELVAEARTVHAGRTVSLTEITVTDPATGKLIAKATATALARPS